MTDIYEKALTLLVDLPPNYKISAVALVLLFFTFWKISANSKILDIVNTSLNVRLQKNHLYKIIRLALLLAAIFSALIVIMAFLAPALQTIADSHKIDVASKAFTALTKDKDYPRARRYYKAELLNVREDEVKSEDIKGLITATYYGQRLHREGLDFICELYKTRAPGDYRYLFAIHAHIRAIRRHDNGRIAEATAQEFREKCGRPDFAEILAYIPLGAMENIYRGIPKISNNFPRMSDEDNDTLADLLQKKEKSSLTKTTPFGDYAAYYLGDYDDVLKRYKDSPIRYLALFDYAFESEGLDKIELLKSFISDYQNSELVPTAYSKLIETLAEIGDRKQALHYATLMKTATGKNAIDQALAPSLKGIRELIAIGDFKSAFKQATASCQLLEESSIKCHYAPESRLEDEALSSTLPENEPEDLTQNTQTEAETDAEPEYDAEDEPALESSRSVLTLAELQFNLNEMMSTLTTNKINLCTQGFLVAKSHYWLRGARAYLDNCNKEKPHTSQEYARNLYLLASVSRRLQEYDKSRDYLLLFIQNINDSPLIDDVYAELGYHYLVIEGNWELAKSYLNVVIEKYPNRNAYDNALWWLARGHRDAGEYATALYLYTKIAALSVSSRFSDSSAEESVILERFANYLPLKNVVFAERSGSAEEGVFVGQAPPKHTKAIDIQAGDRIHTLCGEFIRSNSDVFYAIKNADSPSQCELLLARESFGIKISPVTGKLNQWKSERLNTLPSSDSSTPDEQEDGPSDDTEAKH
jgi:tetratricopeptide (TPR) repeat protein